MKCIIVKPVSKLIFFNSIIPFFIIIFNYLENILINGERFISVKYRLMMSDYGGYLIIVQIIVSIVSFFIWKKRKYRAIIVIIFLFWILIEFIINRAIPNMGIYD